MSAQIASPQNVSSGISAIGCAALLVVAEGVDVRRRVIRRDDDLGVERGPALLGIRVLDVAEDLGRREERVQLRLAGQRL
jgi:hypothetical protein